MPIVKLPSDTRVLDAFSDDKGVMILCLGKQGLQGCKIYWGEAPFDSGAPSVPRAEAIDVPINGLIRTFYGPDWVAPADLRDAE